MSPESIPGDEGDLLDDMDEKETSQKKRHPSNRLEQVTLRDFLDGLFGPFMIKSSLIDLLLFLLLYIPGKHLFGAGSFKEEMGVTLTVCGTFIAFTLCRMIFTKLYSPKAGWIMAFAGGTVCFAFSWLIFYEFLSS